MNDIRAMLLPTFEKKAVGEYGGVSGGVQAALDNMPKPQPQPRPKDGWDSPDVKRLPATAQAPAQGQGIEQWLSDPNIRNALLGAGVGGVGGGLAQWLRGGDAGSGMLGGILAGGLGGYGYKDYIKPFYQRHIGPMLGDYSGVNGKGSIQAAKTVAKAPVVGKNVMAPIVAGALGGPIAGAGASLLSLLPDAYKGLGGPMPNTDADTRAALKRVYGNEAASQPQGPIPAQPQPQPPARKGLGRPGVPVLSQKNYDDWEAGRKLKLEAGAS